MDPEIRLTAGEARLLGVLVEKALTTPEQYPLSLNAATLGANQKSNRHPVLSLSEDEVSDALDGLIDKQLARKVFPGNSRVDKYAHTGTSALKVDIAQLALLAELLMRGPQTVAELRTRVARMVPLDSAAALDALLSPLEARGLIERVPPGHGSRAERHVQCLSRGLHPLDAAPAAASADGAPEEAAVATRAALGDRIAALESTVERLERQLRTLAAKLGEPLDG